MLMQVVLMDDKLGYNFLLIKHIRFQCVFYQYKLLYQFSFYSIVNYTQFLKLVL